MRRKRDGRKGSRKRDNAEINARIEARAKRWGDLRVLDHAIPTEEFDDGSLFLHQCYDATKDTVFLDARLRLAACGWDELPYEPARRLQSIKMRREARAVLDAYEQEYLLAPRSGKRVSQRQAFGELLARGLYRAPSLEGGITALRRLSNEPRFEGDSGRVVLALRVDLAAARAQADHLEKGRTRPWRDAVFALEHARTALSLMETAAESDASRWGKAVLSAAAHVRELEHAASECGISLAPSQDVQVAEVVGWVRDDMRTQEMTSNGQWVVLDSKHFLAREGYSQSELVQMAEAGLEAELQLEGLMTSRGIVRPPATRLPDRRYRKQAADYIKQRAQLVRSCSSARELNTAVIEGRCAHLALVESAVSGPVHPYFLRMEHRRIWSAMKEARRCGEAKQPLRWTRDPDEVDWSPPEVTAEVRSPIKRNRGRSIRARTLGPAYALSNGRAYVDLDGYGPKPIDELEAVDMPPRPRRSARVDKQRCTPKAVLAKRAPELRAVGATEATTTLSPPAAEEPARRKVRAARRSN